MYETMKTPIGEIYIYALDGYITGILFSKIDEVCSGDESVEEADFGKDAEVIHQCKKQLDEYFSGARKTFDVKIKLEGTEFRNTVWKALTTIPYGETRSYADIAKQINSPKAVRAVGGANHNNPISIIVPCHRVIGTTGSLTGYGGGLSAKEWLLNHEKQNML